MTVHESSGNVFADIGCLNPEGMLAEAEILGQIKDLIAERVMSIQQAAEVTGVASSLLTDALRGKLDVFTLGELAAINSILGSHVACEQGKGGTTFGETLLDELADLIDLVICDTNPSEALPVSEWLSELQARADADRPEVRRAIDVCKDYLAS